MDELISAEEYIMTKMNTVILQGAKNYLERYEKPGDSTEIKSQIEYIIDIFGNAQEINASDEIIIRDEDGKITRNGLKTKGLERTSMEQYLEAKRIAGQIKTIKSKERD